MVFLSPDSSEVDDRREAFSAGLPSRLGELLPQILARWDRSKPGVESEAQRVSATEGAMCAKKEPFAGGAGTCKGREELRRPLAQLSS